MPVPVDTLIWHLAVFQRLFAGMEEAAAASDREAMWLYQWAADTLHNVPGMLQRYDEPSGWQSPEDIARWVLNFPDLVEHLGATPRIIRWSERLLSQTDVHETLGLAADLQGLDLAPEAELAEPLRSLYHFCLDTRQRWPRADLDEEDWRVCEFQGQNNGVLARTAKHLPRGLVHWHEFDLPAFKTQLEQAITELVPWTPSDSQSLV
jgi:hypothetical protein